MSWLVPSLCHSLVRVFSELLALADDITSDGPLWETFGAFRVEKKGNGAVVGRRTQQRYPGIAVAHLSRRAVKADTCERVARRTIQQINRNE